MYLTASPGILSDFWKHLTLENFMISAVIAAVVTVLIKRIYRFVRIALHYPAELKFSPHNLKEVAERCRALFPGDTVVFRGQSFKRGARIRVTTSAKKTFEGELVGINKDNVLCVIAKGVISADILDHVIEIVCLNDNA